MSKEKQIEEMAEMLEIIAKAREEYANDITDHTENEYIREALLNAGYRKQREGKWIARKDEGLFGEEYYECSNCHSRNPTIKYNYCKNCGAKMKGGAE